MSGYVVKVKVSFVGLRKKNSWRVLAEKGKRERSDEFPLTGR